MLISQDIPNLVNGVSQQSPSLRRPDQCEDQVNCINSVVEGMSKRPPTQKVGKLNLANPYDSYFEYITRDDRESYLMAVSDGSLQVFDKSTCYEYPVEIDSKLKYRGRVPYLHVNGEWSNERAFQTLPIADTTLLLNKTAPVTKAYDTQNDPEDAVTSDVRYMFTFRGFQYNRSYLVSLQNTDVNSVGNFTGYSYLINGTEYRYHYQTPLADVMRGVLNAIKLHYPTSVTRMWGYSLTVYVPEGTSVDIVDNSHVHGIYRKRWSRWRGSSYYNVYQSIKTSTYGLNASWNTPTPPSDGRPEHEAILWVKKVDYATKYTVTINGSTVSYETVEATTERARAGLQSEKVTEELKKVIDPLANITVAQKGNVLHLTSTSPITISTYDSLGDTALLSFKREVKTETELPKKNVPTGYKVNVQGELTEEDSYGYWLEFVSKENDGTGVWEETTGLDQINYLSLSSMPKQIKRLQKSEYVTESNPYGIYFYMTHAPWEGRYVGDDDSAPWPSFVSDTDENGYVTSAKHIRSMAIHHNRLLLASDETINCSEIDNFFNFFPNTVATQMDNDPIEIAVDSTDIATIEHMVPSSGEMLLFSRKHQFALKSEDVFTSNTVYTKQINTKEVNVNVPPISLNNSTYFMTRLGKFNALQELMIRENSDIHDTQDLTQHVPNYITGDIKKMASSSAVQTVFMLPDSEEGTPYSSTVYVYDYHVQNQTRVQSAHQRWLFNTPVIDIEVDETTLYLVTLRDEGTGTPQPYLEKIDLTFDAFEQVHGHKVHLDCLEWSNTPWNTEDLLPEEETLKVDNRYYRGFKYPMWYTFSPIFYRIQERARTDGRLQLRRMFLNYSDTSTFDVNIETLGRDQRDIKFEGRVLGRLDNLIGKVPVTAGTYSLPIMGRSSSIKVTIYNDEVFGCKFQSAIWEGFYNSRNRRQ